MTRPIGKPRRRPRPRGWQLAGMRSNHALSEARIAYATAIGEGKALAYTVTRSWP